MKNDKDEGLRREIGVVGLASNIINSVVGGGIFVLPAIVAGMMGAAGIFAYLICGVIIIQSGVEGKKIIHIKNVKIMAFINTQNVKCLF